MPKQKCLTPFLQAPASLLLHNAGSTARPSIVPPDKGD
jgi:hypothetical protein